MSFLPVIVIAVAVAIGAAAEAFVKQHGTLTLLYRFATGRHLDGQRRTDAGILRRGTKVLTSHGHASKWAHLPHLHRAGIRLSGLGVVTLIWYGMVQNLVATLWGLGVTALALLILAGVRTHGKVREAVHHHRYVRPLHHALAPRLGVPLTDRPSSWLTVPRKFGAMEGPVIRVALPEGFLAREQGGIVVAALVEKLGLEDGQEISFETVGRNSAAVVSMTKPAPDRVGFAEVRAEMLAASESAPVIGLGRGRAVVSADLDADSPHVLMSAGSGGGKSTTVRAILVQGLHHGALGVILDIKRISHPWARGLPNTLYCRTIEEIHETLVLLKEEVDRRAELADDLADDNGDLSADALERIGPRLYVVCEEMNATANRLSAYWKKIKTKEDQSVSPATEALNDILFMGRQVRVNVIAVAQMMTARALGGPEARENFATRIMARYTVNAWRMLVPEVWPMPRKIKGHGGVQVVKGGRAYEARVVFFTPAEAKEWATSGVVSRFGPLPAHPEPKPLAGTVPPQIARSEGGGTPGTPGPMTLREAVDAGVLTVSLESARAARKRDPEFPEPAGAAGDAKVYDPAALARWERNRPRAPLVSAGH